MASLTFNIFCTEETKQNLTQLVDEMREDGLSDDLIYKYAKRMIRLEKSKSDKYSAFLVVA